MVTALARPVPLSDEALRPPPGEPSGVVRVDGPTALTLTFPEPTTTQRLLYVVPVVLVTVLTLAVLMLLLGMARTLRRGRPIRPGQRPADDRHRATGADRRHRWAARLSARPGHAHR
ncbi:MAG: hypothetical protein H0W56_00665, partial [Acidothermales bacterium]|nr:hypothetical protein [Acidothermales bacterium]